MRKLLFALFATSIVVLSVNAEGTRQVAPNGNITLMTVDTNDIAGMYIDHPSYANFAAYNNPDPNSRLHIRIKDPSNECIFIGFSAGELNGGAPNDYEYRVLDPNGNIVFGPVLVNPANANASNWDLAYNGPSAINGPGGYNAMTVQSADLTAQGWSGEGDYYIEFTSTNGGNPFIIKYWDITVADCSNAVPVTKNGRVWSYNWALFAINDFGFPNRPFNGSFYVCAEDPSNPSAAFVTKVDFNNSGFMPAAFNVAFNSFGITNTGNISADRRSVENMNSAEPEYAIYLNDPVDICETAEVGILEISGVSRCDATSFCIRFKTSKEGQVQILLDFDGPDGMYTPGTTDRLITEYVDADMVGKNICIDWDGLDGLGNPVTNTASTQIPIVLLYAQGIYHFPIYDAELLLNGIQIEAVRPPGPKPLLYYDDSEITTLSGSGEPIMQLNGCVLPCHKWSNYTDPNIPGFGNLNTINSWWFSQQVIADSIFFLPGYYTCNIEGVEDLCPGDTATLKVNSTFMPQGAHEFQIIRRWWSGPNIIGNRGGGTILIGDPGTYEVEVLWTTATGDTCSTRCEYTVDPGEEIAVTIDTLILKGDSVLIKDEFYKDAGEYFRRIESEESCDTLLTIIVVIQQTALCYDLNDCRSVPSDSTNMDYSEFEPKYPDPLSCADVSAEYLRRQNPEVNHHSCTPGVNDSPAMCVSSLDTCDYVPGHERSVVFEVNIKPLPDTAVLITQLSFWEKAPEMFDWISGGSGDNNYPTKYGFRVLRNGTEIYRENDIPTTQDWTLEVFSFKTNPDFIVEEEATFRFEFLGYCLIGDTSTMVTAWDLDEFNLALSCVSPPSIHPIISGKVTNRAIDGFENIDVYLGQDSDFRIKQWALSDQDGRFQFTSTNLGETYYLQAYKNDDLLNGISTRDLIAIKRHLLGRVEFDNIYDFVAADINLSGSVTSADIAQLRQLLLGKSDELPNNNTSWRFGALHQELDMTSVWTFDDPVKIELNGHNHKNHDLVGVKVGDLTDDVKVLDVNTSRTTESWTWSSMIQNQNTITFYSNDEINVHGLQVHLILDQKSSLLEILPSLINLEDVHINITDSGILISWDNDELVQVKEGESLFSLVFDNNIVVDPSSIGVSNQIIDPEGYAGEDLEVREIALENKEYHATGFSLTAFPNPFTQTVNISFDLDIKDKVSIEFYSVSGKLLLTTQRNFMAGHHIVNIPESQLGGSEGLIICKMISSQKMQSIILVKEE